MVMKEESGLCMNLRMKKPSESSNIICLQSEMV